MVSTHMQAISLIKAEDWHAAHQLIQNYQDPLACLIHGFLHRQEGDEGNAAYWYNRAGETLPNNDLLTELTRLTDLASP